MDCEGGVVANALKKRPGATGITCGTGPFACLLVSRVRYKRGYHVASDSGQLSERAGSFTLIL